MIIFFMIFFLVLLAITPHYLAVLYDKPHLLWLLFAPGILIITLVLGRYFDYKEWLLPYKLVWDIGIYFITFILILSLFTFVGIILHAFFVNIPGKYLVWGIILGSLIYIGIARIHGEKIFVHSLDIESEKISREYHFVQLSDIHLGSTSEKYLEHIVTKIQDLNPEFVVITGDLVDQNYIHSESLRAFENLSIPIFLITGNHEYYLREGKFKKIIESSPLLLIDDMRVSYDELDIIGVNEFSHVADILDSIGGVREDRYSLVLFHQPKTNEVKEASDHGIDLMLSGHTHKGQVWPLGVLIKWLQFRYVAGLYTIGNMNIYVNQGTGTWGPQLRLGTNNEITSIKLYPKNI